MEEFLKKFSTIPHKFITDFFIIAKEEYNDSEPIINLDTIALWLDVRKDNIKEVLIKNFEKDYDYTEEVTSKKHSTGGYKYHNVILTPNCFKELCMISQTKKAKEVRKYFIHMEILIKRYYQTIKEQMYKEIGILKINQKPELEAGLYTY